MPEHNPLLQAGGLGGCRQPEVAGYLQSFDGGARADSHIVGQVSRGQAAGASSSRSRLVQGAAVVTVQSILEYPGAGWSTRISPVAVLTQAWTSAASPPWALGHWRRERQRWRWPPPSTTPGLRRRPGLATSQATRVAGSISGNTGGRRRHLQPWHPDHHQQCAQRQHCLSRW